MWRGETAHRRLILYICFTVWKSKITFFHVRWQRNQKSVIFFLGGGGLSRYKPAPYIRHPWCTEILSIDWGPVIYLPFCVINPWVQVHLRLHTGTCIRTSIVFSYVALCLSRSKMRKFVIYSKSSKKRKVFKKSVKVCGIGNVTKRNAIFAMRDCDKDTQALQPAYFGSFYLANAISRLTCKWRRLPRPLCYRWILFDIYLYFTTCNEVSNIAVSVRHF